MTIDFWANNGLQTRQPVTPDERAAMDRCETEFERAYNLVSGAQENSRR
jgi:hypothetical protein